MIIKKREAFFNHIGIFLLFLVSITNSFAQGEEKNIDSQQKVLTLAENAVKTYLEHIDYSIEYYQKKITGHPDDPDLYYKLGVSYFIKYKISEQPSDSLRSLYEKNWEKAMSLDFSYEEKIKRAMEEVGKKGKTDLILKSEEDINDNENFWNQIKMGENLLKSAEKEKSSLKCDQAIETLNNALSIKKSDAVFLLLGDAFNLKFRIIKIKNPQLLEKAIRNWKQIKGIPPEIIKSKIAGAELLMDRKDDVVDLNRRMRYNFYVLQDKEKNKEELNDLISEIAEIIKDNPHDINMYVLLKDIYVFLEKTEEVIAICFEGLRNNPGNIDLLMARGDMYLKTQQYDLAGIDFEKVLKINPDYKWAQERLDMVNVSKQRDEEVIQELLDDLEWQSQFNSEGQ